MLMRLPIYTIVKKCFYLPPVLDLDGEPVPGFSFVFVPLGVVVALGLVYCPPALPLGYSFGSRTPFAFVSWLVCGVALPPPLVLAPSFVPPVSFTASFLLLLSLPAAEPSLAEFMSAFCEFVGDSVFVPAARSCSLVVSQEKSKVAAENSKG